MTRIRFIAKVGVGLLTFTVGIVVFAASLGFRDPRHHSDELTLRVEAASSIVRVRETPAVKVYVTNHGKEGVTLVQPGDGSRSGRRTPFARWSVIGENDPQQQNAAFIPLECSFIESLSLDEVFTLAPGETKEIRDRSLWLHKPGKYRVKYHYENVPSASWKGELMGRHNLIAMWRVRQSTATKISSNEISLTVIE